VQRRQANGSTKFDGQRSVCDGGNFKEVQACRKAGIMINTFMLASDYYLVEFVKQMSAMTNGKAYFANPDNLSQFVLMDFMKRRTSRVK
jgi:Ca-activated chloride channel family protein